MADNMTLYQGETELPSICFLSVSDSDHVLET